MAEAGLAEEVELVGDGAGGVFLRDVVENLLAVVGTAEGGEVVGVALLHEAVDGGVVVCDEVGDPEAAAGAQKAVEFGENGLPVGIVAEVVEDGGGEDDVVAFSGEVGGPDVGLDEGDGAGGAGGDALLGALEHGLAEVEEGAVGVGDELEEFEGVVAGAAADVEDVADGGGDGMGGLGDEVHGEGGVDGGGLAGLEVAEAVDVGVEALADLVDGGFGGGFVVHEGSVV